MESIKLVHELSILGNHLKIGLLMHFFKNFNPEDSNALKICLNSVYIPALEASDYRSAYHQLCDWLYGWNVSDSSQFSSMSVSGDDNPFKTTRAPRDINLDAEVELIECDRLLSTFQTLFQISRRQLIKQHADIEHNLPRIGEGLVGTATMGPGQPKPTKNDSIENQSITDAWLRRQSEVSLGGYDELGDELDDEDNSSIADNRKSSVVGRDTVKIRRGRRGSVTVKAATQYTSDDELAEEIVTESPIKEEDEGAAEFSDFKLGEEGGEVVTKTETEAKEVSTSNVASPDSPKASIKSPKDQAKKTVGPSVMELPKAGVPPGSSGSDGSGGATALEESGQPLPFSFYRPKGGNLLQGPDPNDTVSQTQKDIIFVLIQVDKSTDYTIVNIVNILVILTFSEIVRKKDVHLRYCSQVHELAADFISSTLKAMWDLLCKDFTAKELELTDIRDLNVLGNKIKIMIEKREEEGADPRKSLKLRYRKLHRKFELLHILFSSMDIHVFPRFLQAHTEGCKTAAYSEFDSALWLTGGYDGVIRIHDLRPGILTGVGISPLAQFVGHKSIVTEVHFTKNDANVVSCSFDRTIKIWGASSGNCERTLTGHTDSVTSCYVSKDGRYIASGSMDCTVRLWDFASGNCLAVVKKHTRWVKVVRFSNDSRFVASAGLDRKIFIWDTKLMMNAKNVTYSRCIDAHTDTVLDMAVGRLGHLISTSRDCTVRIFDFQSGHEQHCIELGSSWCCSLSVSTDGEYFATGSFDNSVNIYKTKTGEQIRNLRVFNLGTICVRFPRDLEYVVVGSTEGLLQQLPL